MTYTPLDPYQISKYWKNLTHPNIVKLQETNEKYTDPYFPHDKNSFYSKKQRRIY